MELPSEDTLRHLVTRYAAFVAAHGEAIGTPDLVQPTGEFFPDEFRGDPESVATFMKRILSYAPLADELPVALRFVTPDREKTRPAVDAAPAACSSGGKSTPVRDTVSEIEEGYLVDVYVGDVATATLLGTTLARSAGDLVLREAGEEPTDRAIEAEIAAVASGLGVLLANGSYVYAKGLWRRARPPGDDAVGVRARGPPRPLRARPRREARDRSRAHLDTTPAEAFDAALAWVDSNPEIVDALRSHPATLAAGMFSVRPVKGFPRTALRSAIEHARARDGRGGRAAPRPVSGRRAPARRVAPPGRGSPRQGLRAR
ncbi:MAG: hypothetical protein U0235_25145 [Polyangiaceae bacterium]